MTCAAPRKPGAILAVDNTFATPLNQQPLDFGATVSLQSATKFIGGHSDLLAGVATTNDKALWDAQTGDLGEHIEVLVNDAVLDITHTLDSPVHDGDKIALIGQYLGG